MDGVQFLEGLWYFQPRREGLFVLRTWHGEEFAGWIQVLSLPLKPGRIWYGSPDREESFEVVAVETVTVPAGVFPRSLRLRVRTAESGFIFDFWLAPGVGLVKWQQPVGRGRFQTGTLTEPVRG
jgi:phage gp29-like protein